MLRSSSLIARWPWRAASQLLLCLTLVQLVGFPSIARAAPTPSTTSTPSTLQGTPSASTTSATTRPAPTSAPPNPASASSTEPDRSTPRRTVQGFVRAVRQRDYTLAAHYLDLRALPRATRTKDGAVLAEELGLVLELKLPLELDKISDDPLGENGDSGDGEPLGIIALVDDQVPIALTRIKQLDTGRETWVFSKATIAWIPPLYAAYGAGWLGHSMPEWTTRTRLLELAMWQWILLVIFALISLAAGALAGRLVGAIGRRFTRNERASEPGAGSTTPLGDSFAHSSFGPTRMLFAIAMFDLLLKYVALPATAHVFVQQLMRIAEIVSVAWLLLRIIGLVTSHYQEHLSAEDTAQEFRSRDLRTRLVVLRRVAAILVGVLATAAVLMQFEVVRSIGVSLLASAGIFSVVLGFAAQKTLGTVIAGLQLSIARPVRIGDVVVIEGEFGTVEEVNLTYVVMKLWDERRLIVPISKFLETSFQNWSRSSEEVLGVVLIHVDLGMPLDAMRDELRRFVTDTTYWDGRTCKLQVTDCTDRAMTVRAMVSSRNADDLFSLRCQIREHLIAFVRAYEGGLYLPMQRSKVITDPVPPTPVP